MKRKERKAGFALRTRAAAAVVLGAVCALSLGLFPAAASETEADAAGSREPVLLGSKEAMVFQGTLDSVDTLTTWDVEGEEDVPYVPLDELVDLLFDDSYTPSVTYEWDGNVYSATKNGESILMDLDAQTVYCSDWRSFCGPNAEGQIPAGIVERSEFIALRPSAKTEYTQTEPEGYKVSLADYGFRMFRHEDQVLMPFGAAQALFGSPFQRGILAYNGDDYYDVVSATSSIYGNIMMGSAPNPYATRYFSGRFAGLEEMTEAYAKYGYYSMCMMLDLTYGHKKEKGITDFDSYLEEKGLKDAFLTPDPSDDADSLAVMFDVLFDSGHDGESVTGSIFDSNGIIEKEELIHELLSIIHYDTLGDLEADMGTVMDAVTKVSGLLMGETQETEQEAEPETEPAAAANTDRGPGITRLIEETRRMAALKPVLYGQNNVDIEGDTCIIYFEEFKEDMTREESYYTRLPSWKDLDKSSFALFYHAFEKIKRDGGIRNVVIDLSDNGGGSAAALVSLLGFLSNDGEVHISYRDLLNKSIVSEYYHVDTNLDGLFDDQDGYGGEYNFFIMTSGSSYSCGNALPYYAQKAGLATIIGQQPGGGDCVVANFVDAAGHVGNMSGYLQLGMMEGDEFVSDEKAVAVDLPMSDEEVEQIFFHPDKIVDFIHQHVG